MLCLHSCRQEMLTEGQTRSEAGREGSRVWASRGKVPARKGQPGDVSNEPIAS